MGFLRHDTNDVILDAVLTDRGRELLASQDGSFQIARFALSDEDVDYNVIREFGRVVGKEKIEKNTPVLEAITNTSLSQKSSLISISANNPTMNYLPFSTFTEPASFPLRLSGIHSGTDDTSQNISLTQKINNAIVPIPQDVVNHSYRIEMNNLFLNISGQSYNNVTSNNVASYRMSASTTMDPNGLSKLSFMLSTKNINTTAYSSYIINNEIRTFVTIIGNQDGSEKTFEVIITTTS
jgi:hypothetical protein